MSKNYAPLLANLILYSYEAVFVHECLRDKMIIIIIKNTLSCPSTMPTDISMMFYQSTITIFTVKDTTDSDISASYLHVDILLDIDSNDRLTATLFKE
jgi:ethanolamine utilization protein EutP (predicted NTPase)